MHLSLTMLIPINGCRSTNANAQDRHLQVIAQHPALLTRGDERKDASCTVQQASHSAVAKLSEDYKVFRFGIGLV